MKTLLKTIIQKFTFQIIKIFCKLCSPFSPYSLFSNLSSKTYLFFYTQDFSTRHRSQRLRELAYW